MKVKDYHEKFFEESEADDLIALRHILDHSLERMGPSALKDWYNMDDEPYGVFYNIRHPIRSFF